MKAPRRFVICCLALLAVISEPVWACSVCFGDPDNPMTKGAAAGVWVMVGFIGFVLLGITGTVCFWYSRSRRLGLSSPAPRNSP